MVTKPRTFDHFPPNATCPVCGTNEDAECVLLGIDGTQDGNKEEAKIVHLWCAVATRYIHQGNSLRAVLYRIVEDGREV